MSQEEQEQNQSLPKRISPWIQLVTGIAAVAGVVIVIIRFFVPIGEVDLAVWIRQEIPINLPSEVDSLPVDLTYNGEAITNATLLDVNISNTGSVPIGDEDQWQLTLRTSDESALVLLNVVETEPANLEIEILESPSSDRIILQFGLFNPDDTVDLRLLVIEPETSLSPIIVPETRVPNLSRPIATTLSLQERLQEALLPPTLILLFVIIFIVFLWIDKGDGWRNFSLAKNSPLRVLGATIVLFFASLFFSGLIAQLLVVPLAWGVFQIIEVGLL